MLKLASPGEPPMYIPLPNAEGEPTGLDLSCSLVSDFTSTDMDSKTTINVTKNCTKNIYLHRQIDFPTIHCT